VFIITITVLWVGGFVVSVNAILLGGHMYAAPTRTPHLQLVAAAHSSLSARSQVCVRVRERDGLLPGAARRSSHRLPGLERPSLPHLRRGRRLRLVSIRYRQRSIAHACGECVPCVRVMCVSCDAHAGVAAKQRHGGSWQR
jgi:hypothetical protein